MPNQSDGAESQRCKRHQEAGTRLGNGRATKDHVVETALIDFVPELAFDLQVGNIHQGI